LKEDSVGIVFLLFGLGMLCVLLWYCAVFALPLWVGVSTGFWALAHGAGAGAVLVGVLAGSALFALGRFAARSNNPNARYSAIAAFALPAVYAGYSVISQLSEAVVPSAAWRVAFGITGGIAVGAATLARLLREPAQGETHW
jgi:hypothetical protein